MAVIRMVDLLKKNWKDLKDNEPSACVPASIISGTKKGDYKIPLDEILEDFVEEAVERANEYTDSQVKEAKEELREYANDVLGAAKKYTDEEIAKIPKGDTYDDAFVRSELRRLENLIESIRNLFNGITGTHSVNIENGTPSKPNAFEGESIAVVLNDNINGNFKEWESSLSLNIIDGSLADTTFKFVMPDEDVNIAAIIAEVYSISVENGYADKEEAEEGEEVAITAEYNEPMQQSMAVPSFAMIKPIAPLIIQQPPIGKLYTLQEALAACPEGWHVPTRDEWQELFNFAGEEAGKKLKAATGWNEDGNGTDDFGFAALPENYNDTGYVYGIGTNAIWWSSSPRLDEDGKIAVFGLYYASDYVDGYDFDDAPSLSVRLVKDDGEMPIMGLFMDERDGKTYKVVKIGEQVWMTENLDYTEVSNG